MFAKVTGNDSGHAVGCICSAIVLVITDVHVQKGIGANLFCAILQIELRLLVVGVGGRKRIVAFLENDNAIRKIVPPIDGQEFFDLFVLFFAHDYYPKTKKTTPKRCRAEE